MHATDGAQATVPQLLRNFAIALGDAGPDEDALVTRAVSACMELLQARQCSVLLHDSATDSVKMKCALGYEHLDEQEGRDVVYPLDRPDEELGITGWIFKHQSPVTAGSYDELRRKPGYRGAYDTELHGLTDSERKAIKAAEHPCQQFYGAPISLGDERFGVLKVENKRSADPSGAMRFSESDRAALDTVAAMLALALTYARASREAKERLISYYRFTVHAIRNEIYPIEGMKTVLSEFPRAGLSEDADRRLDLMANFLQLGTEGVHFYLNNLLKFLEERLTLEAADIRDIVENELDLLQQVAPNYKINGLPTPSGDDLDLHARIDRVFFSAVIKEVLRNARQAIERRRDRGQVDGEDLTPGIIEVTAKPIDSMVSIEIGDNGAATVSTSEKEQLQRSFREADVFDARRSNQRTHARLGLAFIKEVISKHGGHVAFDVDQQFTRFSIRVPALPAEGPCMPNASQ